MAFLLLSAIFANSNNTHFVPSVKSRLTQPDAGPGNRRGSWRRGLHSLSALDHRQHHVCRGGIRIGADHGLRVVPNDGVGDT